MAARRGGGGGGGNSRPGGGNNNSGGSGRPGGGNNRPGGGNNRPGGGNNQGGQGNNSGGGGNSRPPGPAEPGYEWVQSPSGQWYQTGGWDLEELNQTQPAPEGYEWVSTPGGGAALVQSSTGGGGSSQACESVKGAAPEGFRWEGSYVKNPDGSISDTCRLVPVDAPEEDEEPKEDTSKRDAQRRMARDEFRSVLQGMGFTTDFGFTQAEINQLYASIEGWISDGWADGYDGGEKMLMLFRTSDSTKSIYQKRFPGMQALAARGQAISEGEYIELERSYRNVLSSYNLPKQYYDSFDDYGRFIAGGVSAAEVEGRVVAAQSAMNPLVARELQDYYGIGQDKALAFLLGMTDEKGLLLDSQAQARNQQTIRDISRNIQIGGLAEGAGFSMGLTESAALAGTSLGQTIDPFDQRTAAQLEGTFAQARRTANRETVLAGIDQEDYSEQDTLLAAFGNDQKRLASERRARRERARFAGSSGAAATSLSVQRNL